MTRIGQTVLICLLRFIGVSALFALIAVFMPLPWMSATHRWLGLGELPTAPVVEYLARSVSVFYALFGAVCLLASSDPDRYRPLIQLLGCAFVLMGIVLIWVDLVAGMPWWWSWCEGPPQIGIGILLSYLARANRRTSDHPETGRNQELA